MEITLAYASLFRVLLKSQTAFHMAFMRKLQACGPFRERKRIPNGLSYAYAHNPLYSIYVHRQRELRRGPPRELVSLSGLLGLYLSLSLSLSIELSTSRAQELEISPSQHLSFFSTSFFFNGCVRVYVC